MTQAEQQAYEVLLECAIAEQQKWEYLARHLYVSLDCVGDMLAISKPDFAAKEVDNARRHFERVAGKAA